MSHARSHSSLVERVTRRLRHEYARRGQPLVWSLRYGLAPRQPRALLTFGGGIGDHLLCTGVFRALRERGERRLWMMSNHAGLFRHNPDIDRVVPVHDFFIDLARRAGARYAMLNYTRHIKDEDRDLPPSNHLIVNMCAAYGMDGPVAVRPFLHLTAAERAAGRIAPRQITVQSSIMAAAYPIGTKEWYPARMQEVVSGLRRRHSVIQLGSPDDPPMEGALDYRGKTSLRESAAILSQSLVFISAVGFLMHLARAVDCRSVVVFGGREHPGQSGYGCNENLFSPVPCAPCWLWNSCPYDRMCMQRITAGAVLAAAERQIERAGQPLPVDYAEVPRSVPEMGIER
ncbi:MAG TPA: glycosyltransferase family 9 protein [Herpetosiphonaceae bacterium]|nr:glycosyltransferase family 9 protein [Herpetosiphonaceae bacterium]